MFRKWLIISGGLLSIIWGISHISAVSSIVKGFGDITIDNKRVLLMEWINEGLTLIFIGSLSIIVTIFKSETDKAIKSVYITTSIMLYSMAVLSLFTGFNIDFIPYKLCPVIFSISGTLILQGAFKK